MILSELQQQIRDLARDFAQERLAPGAAKRDRESLFPREELKEMGIDQASLPTFPQTDRIREHPRQENVRSDKFMPDFGNRSSQLNRSLNKFVRFYRKFEIKF